MIGDTKEQAEKRGKKLLKKMKHAGWKLDLWENLGWHSAISNPPVTICTPNRSDYQQLMILMSDDLKYTHAGSMLWTLSDKFGFSTDPVKLLKRQVAEARKQVNKLDEIVKMAERILHVEESIYPYPLKDYVGRKGNKCQKEKVKAKAKK